MHLSSPPDRNIIHETLTRAGYLPLTGKGDSDKHAIPGRRTHNEPTTATAAVRARLGSAAGALVSVLRALVVLGVLLLGLTDPALAFVLLGLPAAASFGVAFVFGVGRLGADSTTEWWNRVVVPVIDAA